MVGELSEDGEWMWDGEKWIPAPRTRPPTTPPMVQQANPLMNQPQSQEPVFLTPSMDYNRLTAQVEFLGNHQLASDMRSIPLSSTNPIVFGVAFFVSFMLILLVIPMVLCVIWALREGRNKQRRTQMMDSAFSIVQTTPVPAEKIHMASQFM